MGYRIESIPHLALRPNTPEFLKDDRRLQECLPVNPQIGEVYSFYKKEKRLYSVGLSMPLVETLGNCNLTRVVARITILKATVDATEDATYGEYRIEQLPSDSEPLDYLTLMQH